VKYKLLEPSAVSSVVCASTYAFTDSAEGTLVALAPEKVSESTIAFCTLASALASV